MPNVVYIGDQEEVLLVDQTSGIERTVKRGESIEVDAETADRMLEQDTNWARPQAKAAKEAKEE